LNLRPPAPKAGNYI